MSHCIKREVLTSVPGTLKQTGYITCLLTYASSLTDYDQPGHLPAAVRRMSALQRHAHQQGLCGDSDPQDHLWYDHLQVHFICLLFFIISLHNFGESEEVNIGLNMVEEPAMVLPVIIALKQLQELR